MSVKEFRPDELAAHQLSNSKARDKLYNRLDEYQKQYRQDLEDYKMVFVDEPAGTGKTEVATIAALDHLKSGKCDQIIYIRFPSKRGQKLGAIPGDQEMKEMKYMKPFIQSLNKCGLQDESIYELMRQKAIVLTTDADLRGCTLENAFVIVDEAQNADDIEDLRLVLTRIKYSGTGSAIIGHSEQTDSNVKRYTKRRLTAFEIYNIHMNKKPWAKRSRLHINYRGPISKHADDVMETLKELEE